MNKFRVLLVTSVLTTSPILVGCGGSDEPTVIEPTETYELTEQEAKNRERAKKELAEQRQ